MIDYSALRGQVNKNYLQTLILRVDFDDIVQIDAATEKKLTKFLRDTKGFEKKLTSLNEVNIKINSEINLSENSIPFQFDSAKRNIILFDNEEKKIKIEISTFFVVINKYGEFEQYEGFEEYRDLLTEIVKIISEDEDLFMKRIGVRKVDSFDTEDIKKYLSCFNSFLIEEINNPLTSNIQNTAKRISFNEPIELNVYQVHYQTQLQQAVKFEEGKASNVYQLLIDIDVSMSLNIDNDINNNLSKMNKLLFNLFMNSFNEDGINKIKTNTALF